MKNLEASEIWYITGSQHLYGEQTLNQVAANSQKIVEELNGLQRLPLRLVLKLTTRRIVRV
jgi:L-arabinose isomerase